MNQNNEPAHLYRSRRVLILGCGYIGMDIALRLSESGNLVKIMDIDSSTFSRIPIERLESNRIQAVHGDGTFADDLRRASVDHQIDVFIAASGVTSVNIISAQLAQHIIKIPNVLCVVDDEDIEEIYSQIGLQILNRRKLAVEHILIDAMEQNK
ncbi:MAG: NAD-binding protein [Dehalococcoidia bacterium]|jgi:Trk K+ transport system NAD-binding subunit|tara:strand:+ start:41 stop:502 length:462 start_codon:yes stop_codon:yes gene_type:complete